MNEIQLFKDKIKPAIIMDNELYLKNGININNYYNYQFKNSIIISHNPIPDIKNNCSELGKILGYYPKSCDLFVNQTREYTDDREFINFGGIYFNTCGLYNECLNWCKDTYQEKMLLKYGKIKYYRQHLIYDENFKRFISYIDKNII